GGGARCCVSSVAEQFCGPLVTNGPLTCGLQVSVPADLTRFLTLPGMASPALDILAGYVETFRFNGLRGSNFKTAAIAFSFCTESLVYRATIGSDIPTSSATSRVVQPARYSRTQACPRNPCSTRSASNSARKAGLVLRS